MSDDTYRVTDDFPSLDAAQWRERATAELKGKSWERLVGETCGGLEIAPLYTSADWNAADDPSGFPGSAPHVRGDTDPAQEPSWDVRAEFTHPDPAATNAQILRDLSRGATSALLRIDPFGREGVAVRSADDLDAVLADVDLTRFPVALEAGPRFGLTATLLDEVWRRRGVEPVAARGSHQADPLGTWMMGGGLPVPLPRLMDDMAALAVRTAEQSPHMRSVMVKSCHFHNAGADERLELAFTMSTALAYLKALVDVGLDVDTAAAQIQFCIAVDGELFGGIAKLRAARRLWGRVVSASGGSVQAQRMHLVARTSARMMTRRDPWVNILRTTTAAFAAITGGADAITVTPFDAQDNIPDGFSRRIARNVQIILQEESHLGHVIDPAGGCWHLESRTDELARQAWSTFRQAEGRGGMAACLRDGWVQDHVVAARKHLDSKIARRQLPITGVSEYPRLDETSVHRPRPTPPAGDAPGALRLEGEDGTARDPITSLGTYRPAAAFEDLRDAADAHLERTGARPSVFLCTLGTLAQHNARTAWIRNALATGGIETAGGEAYVDPVEAVAAFRAAGSPVAVICSSDAVYAELGPATAEALHEAGASVQILAGRFGDLEDRWCAAGVDQALYMGCDILESLRGLHEALEVSS